MPRDKPNMTTVRALFLEALAMKSELPWREIRQRLIDRGHETGNVMIDEVSDGKTYELTFSDTGEKIRFDGADYHFTRS